MTAQQIPRVLHIVWVGDESIRPDNCIETWRRLNPSWQIRVWGNRDLEQRTWRLRRHIDAMRLREWNGVADMMRWEILLDEGGFAVDADSICVRPLDDALFEGALACAAYENERVRPGLLAAGYVAAEPDNPLIRTVVETIAATPTVVDKRAWRTVGPLRLTSCYHLCSEEHPRIRIWPSHLFMPVHHSGASYRGPEKPYATQEWATTRRTYGTLSKRTLDTTSMTSCDSKKLHSQSLLRHVTSAEPSMGQSGLRPRDGFTTLLPESFLDDVFANAAGEQDRALSQLALAVEQADVARGLPEVGDLEPAGPRVRRGPAVLADGAELVHRESVYPHDRLERVLPGFHERSAQGEG